METRTLRRTELAVKQILAALEDGYRYRSAEMFRFMLSQIMVVWGYKPWIDVPKEVEAKVANAIHAYDVAVASEEPFVDLLGPLYQELASRGGKQILGQFFTPWNIGIMMAQTTLFSGRERVDGRLLTACDPACGSGVLLLALANQVLKQGGHQALRQWSFSGVDIDPICARMMAIQFLANCAVHQIEVGEVIVFCGDSIRVDAEKDLITHASAPSQTVLASQSYKRHALIADAAAMAGVQQHSEGAIYG